MEDGHRIDLPTMNLSCRGIVVNVRVEFLRVEFLAPGIGTQPAGCSIHWR